MWMIAAYSVPGRVIGRDNRLPWHRPGDLRHFKAVTLGHPVIMGRSTWESLHKPLPGRLNVVLSRRADFQAPGAVVVSDLASAARVAEGHGTAPAIIIGGAQIYALALAAGVVTRAYLTEVALEVDGDAYMPDLGTGWSERERRVDGDCTFLTWERSES